MEINTTNSQTIKTKNKKRYKPLYKKFNQILENPQSRQKLFKFKKKKWEKLQNILKKKNFYYKKRDQVYKERRKLFSVSSRRNLAFFFSKRYIKKYKDLLHAAKKLNLFYGGLKRQYMKNTLVKINKKRDLIKKENELGNLNFYFLDFMERRLDAVLYRSFFIKNRKTARQLIMHGYVYVNKQTVKNGSYLIKKNDIVEINLKFHKFILKNIKLSGYWPIPIKNLLVNYKTLQILYTGLSYKNNNNTFSTLFPFKLNVHEVTEYYTYN